ncbi:MAG: 50S ribosomal protein L19 [Candidatus Cloacimonetes bacterium]|nr:50S ribosomal protein L19 [Candidatus Cloacimonadota bacterium]
MTISRIVMSEKQSFNIGDTIDIGFKIKEGDKTRTQHFTGIVIAKKGAGVGKTFTVRKIAVGDVGVERIFPLNSPIITSIKVKKRGKVRRAKLYYLRKRKGKAAMKVKERK